MWAWMERNFPQQHDSYKIIFSPLVGATHRTATFTDNGFAESVMFRAGPDFARSRDPVRPDLLLSQLAFTEITHNYVDATTAGYQAEVETAMGDLDGRRGMRFYSASAVA